MALKDQFSVKELSLFTILILVSVKCLLLALRDKGENRIIVTIDTDNKYGEISESNNTASKTFTIFEDELTPVYPYNFSIVKQSQY